MSSMPGPEHDGDPKAPWAPSAASRSVAAVWRVIDDRCRASSLPSSPCIRPPLLAPRAGPSNGRGGGSMSYRSRTVSLDRAAASTGGGLLPPLYELMAKVRHTHTRPAGRLVSEVTRRLM